MPGNFVHLHCHSHYSLLDGANRIPELVQHTKEQGMNALALTDHGNLYGAIEFYSECKANGINPIIGYEAYVAPTKRTDREARKRGDAGYHLTLLSKNRTGFQNLVKMASLAFTEGYYYVPRIDKDLLEAHHEGLICLSGCASSEFSEFILRDQLDDAMKVAEWFAKLFGNDFYIEIQNNGLDIQKQCAIGAIEIANRKGWPLVATCDAHYLCQDDAFAHEVLLAINTNKKISDEKRMSYGSDQFYVQSPQEMYGRFSDHPDAVARSQEIANGCDIQLDLKARHFPVFTPPKGKNAEKYLREIATAGLKERYGDPPPKAAVDRLELELGIICRMGFASYFLVVWDFVRFALEHNIPCSARGSACGAIVSYVLKLSNVCPLEYDLLFERFLDPNRSEAPDIDIDFCQERRDEILAYVKAKYGENSVAQIATFGSLAAKAALKDVGRVLDVPLDRVNALTKTVPSKLGITLDDALKDSPDFRNQYESDPDVRRWVDIARKLEGTNRNAGTHAAGVVIANGPLIDYVPVQRVVRKNDDSGGRNGEAIITTQWTMGDIEKVGLLKIDLLGLRTLTVLDNTVKLIQKTRGETIDLEKIPLDDRPTYALLQRGEAKGVFQLESDGIRELLKRMKPDNIRDLIATNALYRPGPLGGGMVDAYVKRKRGEEKPTYPHPVMEEILGETHGVMCYQEQVMRILNRLGGIELSSAYACIKAISKKKHEIIDARKAEFLKGAQERGVTETTAREIFDLITFFGGYGFNKSHSAAYALIGYQTAYLKTHFSAEFMAALLTSEIEDGNKRDIMKEHIDDARKLGVEVLPPDVNMSEADFTVKDGKILFGLVAIKGLGRGAAEEIGRARNEGGRFQDIYDLCERIDHRLVPRSAIERLIKAGGLDSLGEGKRAAMFHVLGKAIQSAEEKQHDRKRGQRSFFDVLDTNGDSSALAAVEPLPNIPEWHETERLKYEKEALDFYLSSHPLAQFEAELNRYISHTAHQANLLDDGTEVRIGGMLSQVRVLTTKQGKRFVRCKLEDFSGQAECLMWPEDFDRFQDHFVDDNIRLVQGCLDRRQREEPSFVLSKIFTLEEARRQLTTAMLLRMNLRQHGPEAIDALARILKRSPGDCRVEMLVTDHGGRRAKVKVRDEFQVNPAKVSLEELEMVLGRGGVVFTGR
jgi:DNA polymerase III subunit alpha